MREALVVALQEFAGAMVLVSHDRHLLSSCVDEFWLVADGQVQPYDGDLQDYADWLKQRQSQEKALTNAQAQQENPKTELKVDKNKTVKKRQNNVNAYVRSNSNVRSWKRKWISSVPS